MNMQDFPRVGIGVCVRHEGKVLFIKRSGVSGDGMWCFPGGHLDMYEEIEDGARREVREEVGLEITEPKFIALTNTHNKDIGKHYVTLFYLADVISGEARNMEPNKCSQVDWFSWSALPEPLFWPTRKLVDSGYNPFTL